MFHLIPAPLHRALYRVADKLRRRWWRISKPRRRSVGVLAFDEHGQVLLVRHSYGRSVWTYPGGGIGRNEAPEQAAVREFREELGCGLSDVREVEVGEREISGSRDEQHIFLARIDGRPQPDMREVVSTEWFDPRALPRGCSRLVAPRVAAALAILDGESASQQR